jgi:hypothetical protein
VELHIVTDQPTRLQRAVNSNWAQLASSVRVRDGRLGADEDPRLLTWKHRPIMEQAYRGGVVDAPWRNLRETRGARVLSGRWICR